ncbi:Threonine dehydratase, catabolic [Caballeronia sordidicola]|uniref:Threonine dehydratase, catabolic n=1 Tax=Caballeronia sordidicola TaxID=196367 RepID=A0A226X8N2_CABSO|nr:Threonine dehydratase, catabolic [Caballeronia sordidicola]
MTGRRRQAPAVSIELGH